MTNPKINILLMVALIGLFNPALIAVADDGISEKPKNMVIMDGEYCHAISAAYAAFLANPDVPAEKKELKNYEVRTYVQSGYIRVSFLAKIDKDAPRSDIIAHGNSSPKAVPHSYLINSISFSVEKIIYDR